MADARLSQLPVELLSQGSVSARLSQLCVEVISGSVSTAIAFTVQVQLVAGVWTDITADVLAQADVKYGIDGLGPADLVASSGQFNFSLDNSTRNSAATLGYYSPLHASHRTGWGYGIPCKLTMTYLGTGYVKHYGKIYSIDPEPGSRWGRQVHVTSYDAIRDFAEADARTVSVQVNQSETTLLTAILAALPTSAQPISTSFDTAVDSYAYAFANVGEGVKALGLIADVARSARGYVYITGAGVMRYQSRTTRATSTSAVTFTDTMAGLVLPSNLDGVYNRIRVTIHPKDVDGTSTHVLWASLGTPVLIAADATTEMWITYRDPDELSVLLGGTAMVAMVANTDYVANEAADGSGTDRTALITVTATYYASTAKLTIVSGTSVGVYLTTLQVRGARIRDLDDITVETYTAKSYGDRPFSFDMPYQSNHDVANDAASEIYLSYSDPTAQALALEFYGESGALLTQALAREPGDRITLTETVTGATAVDAIIQSVALDLRPGPQIVCRWGLAPLSYLASNSWILGGLTGHHGELGTGTYLGL